jgi:hypothetical protein
MRKIIIIAVVVIVAGVAAFFILRGINGGGGPSLPGQGGSSGEQNMDNVTGGVSSSDIPSGETLTLGTPSGNVTVKNFYKTALALIEGTEVVLAKNDGYEIDYSNVDSSFVITIRQIPIDSVRVDAESQLLNLLGISKNDACRLSVSVIIPASLDPQAGGRSYPLGICSQGALR